MATCSLATTLSRYLCLAFCAWTFSAHSMGLQMPGGQAPMNAKDDPFSPENIAEVAEEISKLTPEQQEQLYKESLDFLSKELNMAPEEVEKMITDEFTQTAVAPQPTGPAAETLKSEPVPTKKPVEEKVVPVKDLNDVATLLKNLVEITDTIMRKTSGLPDLPSRVDRWVEQKKLSSWQTGLTWARFKKQLELFIQKLGKLQHKDPKTNTYLYLPELLNNVSLKNNLERIYRNLKRYNATFTTGALDIDTAFDDPLALGAGALSAEAKDALLGILNTYGEAFYTQNLLASFDALIQKFDPTAQKLRAEEEASAKKALEASKQPRPTGRIKEAGSRATDGYGKSAYYDQPSTDGGYYPGSSYSPSGYYGGGYPSSYDTENTKPSDSKEGGTGTSSSDSKKAKTPEDKETRKEKEDKSSVERLKWMRDLSKEIAADIRSLVVKMARDLSFETTKEIMTSYQKIEGDLKTLTLASKNFSAATKKDLITPIQETFEAQKEALIAGAQKLEKLATQPQETEGLKAAQEKMQDIKSLKTGIAALGDYVPVAPSELKQLRSLTQQPIAVAPYKEEAEQLIAGPFKEQQLVLKKEQEKALAEVASLADLAKKIRTLDSLIATIATPDKNSPMR